MDSSIHSLFETLPVKFVVGSNGSCKTFYVNEGLVTSQSHVFKAMLNSQMKEKLENTVILKEVEPDTFFYFSEFCLRGCYGTPSSDDLHLSSDRGRSYEDIATNLNPLIKSLLRHAKLFIFAEIYDVQELKKQSLARLYRLLRLTPINGSSMQAQAIISLVRYIYSETSDGPEWNMFRDMVSEYLACVCGKISALPRCFEMFKETLLNYGDLAFDLIVLQSNSNERPKLQNFSPRTGATTKLAEQGMSSEGKNVMETELENYQKLLELVA